MFARTLLVSFALYAFATTLHGAEVEGVKIDELVYIAQGVPQLVLNGAGVRRKFMVAKVYATALYLTQKHTASDAVLSDPGPKRLAMHILQEEITAEQFVGALHDGLAANNQPPELAPLESRIRDLATMMHQAGRINRGSTVLLDYLPGIGTRVSINGVARITIPGDDFNRALLRIWIGDRPVDGRLKQALLGVQASLLPF
jgi:hypothetical protein